MPAHSRKETAQPWFDGIDQNGSPASTRRWRSPPPNAATSSICSSRHRRLPTPWPAARSRSRPYRSPHRTATPTDFGVGQRGRPPRRHAAASARFGQIPIRGRSGRRSGRPIRADNRSNRSVRGLASRRYWGLGAQRWLCVAGFTAGPRRFVARRRPVGAGRRGSAGGRGAGPALSGW